jgi:pimeloyl-ACP methyl ester carboxylesterase
VEWGWWYQYHFATERGRAGLEANRRELAKLIWKFNSPTWDFDDATFDRTAASFDNPDYVSVVIHNYRWRLSLAEGDPQYDELERRLADGPVIAVPAITLDGDADGVAPATDGTSYAKRFSGKRTHRIVKGVGHNLPQEAPQAFTEAVLSSRSTVTDRRKPAPVRNANVVKLASRLEGGTDGPGCKRMEDVPHESQPALPRYDAPGGGSTTH